MEEYTVNFLADVDVTIKAESPEEARKKAEKMFGEYHDKQFGYAYLSEIKFITTADGTEVQDGRTSEVYRLAIGNGIFGAGRYSNR